MADIAILVAEEYERRVKAGLAHPPEIGTFASAVSAAARSVVGDNYSYCANVVADFCLSEPKTQIGVAAAASDCFFSA